MTNVKLNHRSLLTTFLFDVYFCSLTITTGMSLATTCGCCAWVGLTIWGTPSCWPSWCNFQTSTIETCRWPNSWSLCKPCLFSQECTMLITWYRHRMISDFSMSACLKPSPIPCSSVPWFTPPRISASRAPLLPPSSSKHLARSVKLQSLATSRQCHRSWCARLVRVWVLEICSRRCASWPLSTMEWNPWTTLSSCHSLCCHTFFSSCTSSKRVCPIDSIRMFSKLSSELLKANNFPTT